MNKIIGISKDSSISKTIKFINFNKSNKTLYEEITIN